MKMQKCITAAACACAVLAGGLTAQAGSWVGLSSSGVEQTYVDGVPAVFPFEENQKMYYPVLYKDAAYIPLRTAAMWMGKNIEWDEETETATLSGTAEKKIPSEWGDDGSNDDETWVGWYHCGDSGSAMLRPEFKIVLDGKKLDFTNARGETIYPLVFEDAIYLPLRNIGELTGYQVTWSQGKKKGENGIFLNTPATDAEFAEMVEYTTELYDKLKGLAEISDKMQEGFHFVPMSGTNEIGQQTGRWLFTDKALAEEWMPQVKARAQEIRSTIEKPKYKILEYSYNQIVDTLDTMIAMADPVLERIRSGTDLPCDSDNTGGNYKSDKGTLSLFHCSSMFHNGIQTMMRCAKREIVWVYLS